MATLTGHGLTYPIPVIVEDDFATDSDDFMGLRGWLNLERMGLVQIIAVICNSVTTNGLQCAGTLCHYHGRDAIPGGTYKGAAATTSQSTQSAWVATVAGANTSAYPVASSATDAVTVIRTVLAAAANGTVLWVNGGFCSVGAAVLQSAADGISGLTGLQLVTNKVGLYVSVSGTTPITPSGNGEYNLIGDPASSNYLFANYPGTLVICGVSLCNVAPAPVLAGTILSSAPAGANDPLYQVLNGQGVLASGRPAWGAVAPLIAGRALFDDAGFSCSPPGSMAVANQANAAQTWTWSPTGKHQYLGWNANTNSDRVSEINRLLVPHDGWQVGGRIGMRGVAKPPSPQLLAQYDASAIVGLSDGQSVTAWNDVSGNGANLASGGTAPVYNTAIQNGLSVVRMGGAGYLVYDSGTTAFWQDWPLHCFVICVRRAQVNNAAALALTKESGNDWDNVQSALIGFEGASGGTVLEAFRANAALPSLAHPGTNVAMNIASWWDGISGYTQLGVSGTPSGTASSPQNNASPFQISRIVVGGRVSTGFTFFNQHDYCEVRLYGGHMNATQRQAIMQALATKWGTP